MADPVEVDLSVPVVNIIVTRGKRFQYDIYYVDMDISGYTFDFRVRTSRGDGAGDLLAGSVASGHVVATYPITDPDGDTTTRVRITFTATEMQVVPGEYPWEIEPTGGGVKDPTMALQGTFIIKPEYTL